MQGGFTVTESLAHAGVVLDLALAGVKSELGDSPYGWLEAAPVAEKPVFAEARVPEVGHTSEIKHEKHREPIATPVAPVVAAPVESLWSEGDNGGVVLVVDGPAHSLSSARPLAEAMLAAVGCDLPVGWVGGQGDITARLKAMDARRVLVLGQGPLGLLLGSKLGVDGWHASGRTGLDGLPGVTVGVTYPFDLLLRQPLFKRLAWQHLLAWKLAWQPLDNQPE